MSATANAYSGRPAETAHAIAYPDCDAVEAKVGDRQVLLAIVIEVPDRD